MMPHHVCISDLDGTLLGSDRKVSSPNLTMLDRLGNIGITRVLATGRSLWSLRRVLKEDAPLDYVIFATGAGIMDWKTQELIYSCDLDKSQIRFAFEILEGMNIDYMLHKAVPDTHYMHYRSKHGSPDFWERISYYRDFAEELDPASIMEIDGATQFMAIVSGSEEHIYSALAQKLQPLNTIRTTSPIDFSSLWIEIFAPEVTKGKSIQHLMKRLGTDISEAMVIGNDFNDVDMLKICPNAYVTMNAPQELKDKYYSVSHHDEDGFCEAVTHWLDKIGMNKK